MRKHIGDAGHDQRQEEERQRRQPGHQRQQDQQQARDIERARIRAHLAEDRLVGRPARTALRNEKAGGERHDQRRDLADEAVAHRQLGEHVRGLAEAHVVARIADRDAADDVDRGDDQPRYGVAADEFRRTVHGTKEGTFLFELAAPVLGFLVVDHAGRKIGVDRHLLAGDRVEREARADFGDAGRALGDDDEIDHDQDQEDDQADDEIAAHHQIGKAADHIAGRIHALVPFGQYDARRRDVERQPEHRRDQQDRWKRREVQRPRNPQRDHQDQDGKRDRERQADIDEERWDRQEEHRQDRDDADREADVASVFPGRGGGDAVGECHSCRSGLVVLPDARPCRAGTEPRRSNLCENVLGSGPGQKPCSIRWNTTFVNDAICAPTNGPENATASRIATIFGTKVRVISWTCVSAWTSAMPTPTTIATITAGPDATSTVHTAY